MTPPLFPPRIIVESNGLINNLLWKPQCIYKGLLVLISFYLFSYKKGFVTKYLVLNTKLSAGMEKEIWKLESMGFCSLKTLHHGRDARKMRHTKITVVMTVNCWKFTVGKKNWYRIPLGCGPTGQEVFVPFVYVCWYHAGSLEQCPVELASWLHTEVYWTTEDQWCFEGQRSMKAGGFERQSLILTE